MLTLRRFQGTDLDVQLPGNFQRSGLMDPVRELACEMRALGCPAHLASGITDPAKEKFPTQRPTRNKTCVG